VRSASSGLKVAASTSARFSLPRGRSRRLVAPDRRMGLLGLDDRAHPGRRPRPVNALCRHPARLASPKRKSTVRSARTHAPALRACVPTWRWWPKSPTTSSILRIVRPSRHDVARLHGSGPAELRGVAQSSCPAGGDGELSGAAGGAGWRRLRRDCPALASPSQNGRRNLGCGLWPIGSDADRDCAAGVVASDDRKWDAAQLRAPRPRFATTAQRRLRSSAAKDTAMV
jgi:hypothetical protein